MNKFLAFQLSWMPVALLLSAVFGWQCAAHHMPAYVFIPCMFAFGAAMGLLPWGVRYAIPRAFDGA